MESAVSRGKTVRLDGALGWCRWRSKY